MSDDVLSGKKNCMCLIGYMDDDYKSKPLSIVLPKVNTPIGKLMFKVDNRNTKTRCEIRPKLTMKMPAQHQKHCSGVFIVNFEYILQLVLVFLLLTLSR